MWYWLNPATWLQAFELALHSAFYYVWMTLWDYCGLGWGVEKVIDFLSMWEPFRVRAQSSWSIVSQWAPAIDTWVPIFLGVRLLLAYWAARIAWGTYRLVKSWIPSVSG